MSTGATRWGSADLVGRRVVWLVTVDYAGRRWRFSTSPATPIDADGVSVPHDGGLTDISIDHEISGPGQEPTFASASMSLLWPGTIADLVGAGYDLSAATAELALWAEGTSYESRRVYAAGPVDSPVYGAQGETVDIGVTYRPWEGGSILPPMGAMVTLVNWPTAPTSSIGQWYPEVIGAPGELDDGTTVGATPGIPIETDPATGDVLTLLIAGHPVEAVIVTVYDRVGGSLSLPVATMTDGLFGRTVSVVSLVASGLSQTQSDYDIAWHRTLGTGGGGRLDEAGRSLSGAGSMLRYYLRQSGARLDEAAWDAIVARLDQVQVGGYLQTRTRIYDWLTDQIVALLPIELIGTPRGVRPVLWDFDGDSSAIVGRLVDGENVHIGEHAVTYSDRGRIVNEYTVTYAYDRANGSGTASYTVGGSANAADTVLLEADTSQRQYAAVPGDRYIASDDMEAEWLWSARSTARAATWRVRALALMRRTVTVTGWSDVGWIAPGDLVSITSARHGLSDAVAQVQRVSWASADEVEYSLSIYAIPHRDRRT